MKPASDLCLECQQNATLILQCANFSEEDKSEKLKVAKMHTTTAKRQREDYNDQCKEAKTQWETYRKANSGSYNGVMHYSFDYAQNIQYPSKAMQK